MKKAVILLGAGVPRAWDGPSSYDIEQSMFNSKSFLIVGEDVSLAKYIKDKIVGFTDCNPNDVNFEHIINTLEILCDFTYEEFRFNSPRFVGTKPIWFKFTDDLNKIKNFKFTLANEHSTLLKN